MPDDLPFLLTVNVTRRAPRYLLSSFPPVPDEAFSEADETTELLARVLLLLTKIKTGLSLGTKYYHPRTGKLLASRDEILDCLIAEAEVIFRSPQ